MIQSLWMSVANTVVAPLQDLLSLNTEARMNFPGKLGGNWTWRVLDDQLTDELQAKLLEFNTITSTGREIRPLTVETQRHRECRFLWSLWFLA
jgi:4-alpha-glucanotransferase